MQAQILTSSVLKWFMGAIAVLCFAFTAAPDAPAQAAGGKRPCAEDVAKYC